MAQGGGPQSCHEPMSAAMDKNEAKRYFNLFATDGRIPGNQASPPGQRRVERGPTKIRFFLGGVKEDYAASCSH